MNFSTLPGWLRRARKAGSCATSVLTDLLHTRLSPRSVKYINSLIIYLFRKAEIRNTETTKLWHKRATNK